MPSLGLGLGIHKGRSLKGISPEAKAWEANIIANSGTIPAATLKIFDDYFFKPAKANGNILNNLDRFNFYAGLNGFEIAARTNMIKAAHFVTPVSGPLFDKDGYRRIGTSYLNLNYTPSAQGDKFKLNDNIMFCGVKNPTFSPTYDAMGCRSSGTRLQLTRVTNLASYNNTPSNNNLGSSAITGVAFMATLRSGASAEKTIINASELAGVTTSVSLPTFPCFELTATDTSGNPSGNYDAEYHYYSGHGSSALDYTALRTIISGLITALGL
jgi:hypothetical protein